MSTSPETVATLKREHARLTRELREAAKIFVDLREQARLVTELLRSFGDSATMPDDVPGVKPPPPDVDDSALDHLIAKHITARKSGFKPVEMYRRLVQAGVHDDGKLAARIIQRLAFMENEKILRRSSGANRYQASEDAVEYFLGTDTPF